MTKTEKIELVKIADILNSIPVKIDLSGQNPRNYRRIIERELCTVNDLLFECLTKINKLLYETKENG